DLREQYQRARHDPEQHNVGHADQRQSEEVQLRVDIALEPVVGRAMAVAYDRLPIAALPDVQEHSAPQNTMDAQHLRAVRILRGLALGMMLAMDRDPLFRHHARRQPQPEPEEMTHGRMQLERAMRLVAMKEYRDRDDGDVGQHHGRDDAAPPWQVQYSGEKDPIHPVSQRRAARNPITMPAAVAIPIAPHGL